MEGGQKDLMKSFVSESDLAEVKKKRQEEWEKNRKPGQPLERPDQPVDNRSLYERLQAQKREKDAKYEEEHKFSNQIRRLDEEDAEFLSSVTQKQTEMLKQNKIEEQLALKELKEHQSRQNLMTSNKLKINLPTVKIVPGSAKRKRSPDVDKTQKKSKTSDEPSSISPSSASAPTNKDEGVKSSPTCSTIPSELQSHASKDQSKAGDDSHPPKVTAPKQGADLVNKTGTIEVLGFLPGIGPYVSGNSSSSDSDSDDEGSLMKCFTKKHFTQKQMLKMMRKGS